MSASPVRIPRISSSHSAASTPGTSSQNTPHSFSTAAELYPRGRQLCTSGVLGKSTTAEEASSISTRGAVLSAQKAAQAAADAAISGAGFTIVSDGGITERIVRRYITLDEHSPAARVIATQIYALTEVKMQTVNLAAKPVLVCPTLATRTPTVEPALLPLPLPPLSTLSSPLYAVPTFSV